MKFNEKYKEREYIESEDKRLIISLKDNKGGRSNYRGNNQLKQSIIVYRIDGGIINDEKNQKCDYAIYTNMDSLYFIELKGSDYNQALKQIISTIEKLIKKVSEVEVSRVYARIVLSKGRTPEMRTSLETELKNILKKTKVDLRKGTIRFTENIDENINKKK
jgi:hypothetical protein